MADAQRPQGAKRRTIRGDSPSRQPPPVSASAPAPGTPPVRFDAFDEAPTVARLAPLAASPTRSEHPTLLGVPPPPTEESAPPLAPAFVAQPQPWTFDARRSPPQARPEAPRAAERVSPARGALVAVVFVAAVLGALAAAKAGLDARVRSHPERPRGADPALDVGLPPTRR